MGIELPALCAVVARMPDAKINLAAYGGVVFPIALIVESPIIMLLAASTALAADLDAYRKLRRFMITASVVLTVAHVAVAFTPLYWLIARNVLGAPEAIIGPARAGLMIMTPWTAAIAYRRFQQGVLIRFGHSRPVVIGTGVRLAVNLVVLAVGYAAGLPGVVVATSAVAAGVTGEAVFAGIVVRPVRRKYLLPRQADAPLLTRSSFLHFYVPLAMTSLLALAVEPMATAAVARMPNALDSLATWSPLFGLVFMTKGAGIALNEVVVALRGQPDGPRVLRRFAILIAVATSGLLCVLAATPLSRLWFGVASALPPAVAALAGHGFWLAVALPALTSAQCYFQGTLMHAHRTRGITEAVAVYLIVIGLLLGAGVAWSTVTGLYVALGSFTVATSVQALWLARRVRRIAPVGAGPARMTAG